MKNAILIALLAVVVMACPAPEEKNMPPLGIEGQWMLTASLLDPGDGSGTFMSVESDKTIQLLADGTWTSNGSMCGLSAEVDMEDQGTYDDVERIITIPQCVSMNRQVSYDVVGDELFLTYMCIEPCRLKFERL